MRSIEIYRAFGNIDDALLEAGEAFGGASPGAAGSSCGNRGAYGARPLRYAGRWLRRHSGLAAALAVCIAVGAFAVFGGEMLRMGAEAPASVSSSVSSEEGEAASETPMYSNSVAESALDDGGGGKSVDAEDMEQPQAMVSGDPENSGIAGGFSFGGIKYEAVYDDVYRLGEVIEGENIDNASLYRVEGYEPEDMLALYDPESDLAVFYRAVPAEEQ